VNAHKRDWNKSLDVSPEQQLRTEFFALIFPVIFSLISLLDHGLGLLVEFHMISAYFFATLMTIRSKIGHVIIIISIGCKADSDWTEHFQNTGVQKIQPKKSDVGVRHLRSHSVLTTVTAVGIFIQKTSCASALCSVSLSLFREDLSSLLGNSTNTSSEVTTHSPVTTASVTTASVTTAANQTTTTGSTTTGNYSYLDELTGICRNITSGVHIDILYAQAGLSNYQPIYNIVGARIRLVVVVASNFSNVHDHSLPVICK
jgi:hypothetical protein